MKNTNGSNWSKWDLHLHTYYTHLNNQFNAVSEDDYINKIVDSGLKVVGLTNYFNFKDEDYSLKQKLEDKGITVFMNLELRLSYQNKEDDLCDFHIIFSDKVTEQEIREFLVELKVTVGAGKIKAKDVTDYDNGSVDFDDVINLLQESLNGKYLTGILARGKGNSRSSSLYEKFVVESDLVIHSTDSLSNIERDFSFFTGIGKPLTQNSDAHKIEQIGGKFTWIKAEPTFEGLKQIIYEPQLRIKIQQDNPNCKPDYEVIDRIEIDHEDFGKQTINFNPDLNVIIGGRSSGKSILLGVLAKKCNNEKEVKKDANYNKLIGNIASKSKIYSKNGAEDVFKTVEYFPQSFINKLAYESIETKKILSDIVMSDDERSSLFRNYQQKQADIKAKINENFLVYSNLSNNIDELRNQLKGYGNINDIKKEIERIESVIGDISKGIVSYTFDKIKFEEAKTEIIALENKSVLLKNDILQLDVLLSSSILKDVNYEISSLTDESKKFVETIYSDLRDIVKVNWNDKIKEKKDLLRGLIDANDIKISSIKADENYVNAQKFYKENEALSRQQNLVDSERKKIDEIVRLENQLKETLNRYNVVEQEIYNLFKSFEQIVDEYCRQIKFTEGDLTISAKKFFRYDIFKMFVSENFDARRGNVSNLLSSIGGKTQECDELFLRNWFSQIERNDFPLKRGFDRESINTFKSNVLMTNFWDLIYDVKYQNDSLETMSEGKKAFVILRLLLDFSKNTCPILLDQPEDDLDNRAIYSDLVEYIRTKKQDRQIIIVSHNPNIAVATDAEEIIVANQNGDKTKNAGDVKFQYRTGAIEDTLKEDSSNLILEQKTIKEHVCEILEGGTEAFKKREHKYGI